MIPFPMHVCQNDRPGFLAGDLLSANERSKVFDIFFQGGVGNCSRSKPAMFFDL